MGTPVTFGPLVDDVGAKNFTEPEGDQGPSGYCTLALDPATGDLPRKPFLLRGTDAIIQKFKCRAQFLLGEWFLDTRLGVPWLQRILIKNPDLTVITAILTQVATGTPGIASVKSFDTSLDRNTRKLDCNFVAILDDGSTVRTAVPLIFP